MTFLSDRGSSPGDRGADGRERQAENDKRGAGEELSLMAADANGRPITLP
jgi:hypothetical protein